MAKPFATRDFDGIAGLMNPEKADPADGKRYTEKLVDMLNTKTGQATIPAASSSVVVAVGAEYDGQPAFATLGFIDGTLTTLLSAGWDGSGNLTITGNANATADTLVHYRVEG